MKKLNKFFIIFIAAAVFASSIFGFVIPPKTAQAIPVEEVGPVGVVIGASLPVIATGVGVAGSGTALVDSVKATLGAPCIATLAALQGADTVENLTTLLDTSSTATFNIIGGGAIEATKLTAKIAKATAAKSCVDTYIAALDVAKSSGGSLLGLNGETSFATEMDRNGKISAALQQIIENYKAQQSASVKDILKAFMVKLVLNLNKTLTTSMVNKMVEKYKISDYLAYGDALASQVYSMKYINENYKGDARQQMIIRSLLQSNKLPDKVKTAQAFATSKAQDYLASACGATGTTTQSQDLNSYIKCLSAYGSPEASGQYHMLQGIDQAQAASQSGKANASAEISQGNGFAPPRDCKGTLVAQKNIDTQFDKAATDLRVASIAKDQLAKALQMSPPRTTQSEYDKAVAAEAQAKANELALRNQSENPIVDICEAIDTPASFVSNSIGSFLSKHLEQASQLKSDNLPFYASFISDVASNFLTNILTGGKSTSQVLKEAGTGALGSAGGIIGSLPSGGLPGGSSTFPQGNLIIYAYDPAIANGGRVTALVPGKNYVVVVDFVELINDNPYKIKVDAAGSSIAPINRELTPTDLGNQRININYTATSTPLELSVVLYAKNPPNADKVLSSKVQRFTVTGDIQGASIVLPRGPSVSLR